MKNKVVAAISAIVVAALSSCASFEDQTHRASGGDGHISDEDYQQMHRRYDANARAMENEDRKFGHVENQARRLERFVNIMDRNF